MIGFKTGETPMATFAIVIAQAVAALTLSQVREMPPPVAGNVVLGDLPHGKIQSFKYPTGGMLPLDAVEGQFVEKPNLQDSICVKKVWTVLFRATPGSDIETAKPKTTRHNEEIALPIGHRCPSGQYAYLNPGIRLDQGEATLHKVKDIRGSRKRIHFTCSDETSSGLCAGDKAVRTTLRTMKPWLVTGGGNEVLLGVPGGVATQIRFGSSEGSAVQVKRFVPAPF